MAVAAASTARRGSRRRKQGSSSARRARGRRGPSFFSGSDWRRTAAVGVFAVVGLMLVGGVRSTFDEDHAVAFEVNTGRTEQTEQKIRHGGIFTIFPCHFSNSSFVPAYPSDPALQPRLSRKKANRPTATANTLFCFACISPKDQPHRLDTQCTHRRKDERPCVSEASLFI